MAVLADEARWPRPRPVGGTASGRGQLIAAVYASRFRKKITPAATARAAYPHRMAKLGHGPYMGVFPGGCALAIHTSPPARAGIHLSTWFCHDSGRKLTRIVTTKSSPTIAPMPPALCRRSSPRPNDSTPQAVRNNAPPMTARSTSGLPIVVLMWSEDISAWPTKNAAKAVTRLVTSATTANTTPLAAIITPRCGLVVSVVRIMPVEYSELITSTPSTPMISCPMYRPARLCRAGSKSGPCGPCAAPALASAPNPTTTTNIASSAQYVDRTDLILVNSEHSAPANVTRPAERGRSSATPAAGPASVDAISGHLSSHHRLLGHASVELHAAGGQLHERLLQRRVHQRQFVQPDLIVVSEVPDLVRI